MKNKLVLELDCRSLVQSGALKKHPTADVLVCKVGDAKVQDDIRVLQFTAGVSASSDANADIMGLSITNISRFADVGVSSPIYLCGYPSSLGREAQLDPSRPLLRYGIVAGSTENDRIVIDCPVYFGTSGGLVLEQSDQVFKKTFKGIGIAVEMIPFVEKLWSQQFNVQTGVRYENSGYALVEPMDRILELIDEPVTLS